MKTKLSRIRVLAVLLFTSTACWAQTAPKVDKTILTAGIKETVVVRRDERGVAHIEAKTEADLFFAQGVCYGARPFVADGFIPARGAG